MNRRFGGIDGASAAEAHHAVGVDVANDSRQLADAAAGNMLARAREHRTHAVAERAGDPVEQRGRRERASGNDDHATAIQPIELAAKRGNLARPRDHPLEPGERELASESAHPADDPRLPRVDRKSIRLNSSHGYISYAVFCLKKKKKKKKAQNNDD